MVLAQFSLGELMKKMSSSIWHNVSMSPHHFKAMPKSSVQQSETTQNPYSILEISTKKETALSVM
jgi:hypothetical protein